MADGRLDFWRIYDAHYDEITGAARRAAAAHPQFAAVIAAMSPEELAERSRQSRERLRAALCDGARADFDADLLIQGVTFARMGIAFAGWADLIGTVQRELVPRLVAAYGGEPARLTAALLAMQTFVDRSMVVIGDGYLGAQEQVVFEQRQLAEESEERYQMLFDNGPVPMWVYDVETKRFLIVNRAAVEHYGFSEREFLSMTIEDIRHPDDLPLLRAEEARKKSNRMATNLGEWRHRKKDGSSIDVELRLENFIFRGRRAHLIVAADVTERREAARALETSEERYRSLVAATTSVVWTSDADGRFVAPQPTWEAYTGQDAQMYAGLGWMEAVHPDDRGRVAGAFSAARAKLSLYEAEGRLWHAPSRQFRYFVVRAVPILDERGAAREWVGTVTDVDDEKKAEAPGRFFTLSLDLLCIAGADGYFKRLNPAFGKLGYTEAELTTTPFLAFVHPDDVDAASAEVARLGCGGQTVAFEIRFRAKDGSYRHLNWNAAADPSGTIYAAARDVTDDKRIEAERLELNRLLTVRNEELTRASRAKSDFLAMMSHELRTPLNSIIGFSEVLIDGKFGALNDKQLRYLGNVLQSGRHLLGLINDLLDLSKIEAGRLEVMREPCAVRPLVAEAMMTLKPLADARKVTLVGDPAPAVALPPVLGDAARVKQVLYNLMSNAIKFTPAEGRVAVRCSVVPGGDFVRVSVSDTGTGISATDVARLYQPFTQLANARDQGGTGLGLALTRQLVELMGGRIGVESEVGHGSTFYFDLPLEVASAALPGGATTALATAPLALVVDDDAAARELLALALQEAGFCVRAVGSGEEAIAEARRQRPAVITLDVFLPSIDGWDALKLLKSDPATAEIPVVMVSISSDRAKAFSLGAQEHLVKPVGREALIAALARRNLTTQAKRRRVDVLAIDDDARQLELFRAALEPHGFRVRTESSGRAGLAAASSAHTDVVLLDLMMPDLSGIEVVAALRANERTRGLPILLVTAHELSAADRARLHEDVEAIISKGATRMEDLVQEITRVLRPEADA